MASSRHVKNHLGTSAQRKKERKWRCFPSWLLPFSLPCVRDVRRQIWTPPIQNGRITKQTNSRACYSTFYIFKRFFEELAHNKNQKWRKTGHRYANGIARKSLFFSKKEKTPLISSSAPLLNILNACFFVIFISRISHSVWLQQPTTRVPSYFFFYFTRSFNVLLFCYPKEKKKNGFKLTSMFWNFVDQSLRAELKKVVYD